MNVLMTGATGLIGKQLGKALAAKKHHVLVMSRSIDKAKKLDFPCEIIQGDLMRAPVQSDSLSQVEAVIHLLGENIAQKRWTPSEKQKILDSRKLGTRNLLESLSLAKNLKVISSASAVGFYGDRGDEDVFEESSPGIGFLSLVCQEWEKSFTKEWKPDRFPSCRWNVFRFGIVLSQQGGALPKMIAPFKLGLGGNLGSGRQWQSWIHIEDLVRLLIQSIEDKSMSGIYNAVSPNPQTNAQFTSELGRVLGKRVGLSVPEFALKIALGEMSSAVLSSQKASAKKIIDAGFEFKFPQLSSALEDLLDPKT